MRGILPPPTEVSIAQQDTQPKGPRPVTYVTVVISETTKSLELVEVKVPPVLGGVVGHASATRAVELHNKDSLDAVLVAEGMRARLPEVGTAPALVDI